jgi:murein DD-endopeptidase MepM/ murein hydrolase activator NlpD
MSQRSGHYPEHPHRHGHEHARAPHRRTTHPGTAHHGPRTDENGYTFAHAGKQVRIGPVVFWIVAGSIMVMGAWSAATATYFAFRDDVLTRLLARQAEMQYAYEDRIAELRARVDRTTSRQLLDQEQYDQKLSQIIRRQAVLESRAAALSAMSDVSITGSLKTPIRAPQALEAAPAGIPKPSPINDTVIFVAPPDREARLESRRPAAAVARTDVAKTRGVDNTLLNIQTALDKVENRQIATLNAAEESYDSRMRRMRGVISDLGLNMAQLEAATPKGGMGGPFVPVPKPGADANVFDKQLYRIHLSRAQVDKLTRTLSLVPYRKPVIGNVEFSSGFGVRSDPFLGRPAMHTGLDFRAATGDPVRATANGKVVTAGWSGGYGRMVEIDHGNGLSTRYGHLSEINVRLGEAIKIGQVIGAVGSTGRSTGPHLHYETRIDGDAVDPQKFLRAGIRLSQG